MRLASTFSNLLLSGIFLSVTMPCAALAGATESTAATFAQAHTLLREGHGAEAVRLLGSLTPSALDPVDRFNLGWLYGQAHEFKTALTVFQSVPAEIPDPVTHAYALALCHFQLADYRSTIGDLAPLSESPAFDPKLANLLGVAYSKVGSGNQAFAAFQAAIRNNPQDPTAYFNSVTLLCETGHLTECLAAAQRTATVFPSLPEAHLTFGAAQLENGRMADSIMEFKAARQLNPKSAEAAFFEALVLYRAGDYQAAANVLRSAIRDHADDADVHTLFAESLLRCTPPDPDAALLALNAALTLNPKSAAALAARGKVYVERKQYLLAITDLELAIRSDSQSRPAIYTLARAYQALGNRDRARELLAGLPKGSDDAIADLGQRRVAATLQGGGPGKDRSN